MKNIYELLKSIGIEVPEDKKKDFDSALSENYKTVAELNNVKEKLSQAQTTIDTLKTENSAALQKRDEDLNTLRDQLEKSGGDSEALKTLQTKFETLQEDYKNAQKEADKKLAKQQYEFLVREKCNGLKFTSNGAKKSFVEDVLAKNLSVENDKLLGFDEFVNVYKEQDAGAFVVENDSESEEPGKNTTKPTFVAPTNKISEPNKDSDKPSPTFW